MLAYFPIPYPDELLLSVLARLADIMQYPRPADLSRALFGQNVKLIAADLPNRLTDLVAALPPGHPLTVDRLIDEHTLYPFYQPFLPQKRATKVRDLMRGNETRNGLYGCVAIFNQLGPMPKFFRFCPECVQAERRLYGQCYWHRLHQAPGVYICPTHQTPLQDSPEPMYYRIAQHRYRSAEQVLQKIEPPPHDLPATIRPALLQIARDVEWLLQHRHPEMTPASLSSRFHRLLAGRGLATYSGIVNVSQFLTAFKRHYPPELFHFLKCALDYDSPQAWPQQVVKNKNKFARHPLHSLLVIHFLGYTAPSFFALPAQASYFGQGPWPCLNPVCEHYRQTVIAKYQLDYTTCHTRPRGTFVCIHCGFIYRRVGPDAHREDRFRLDRIMSRGPVWEEQFRQAWTSPARRGQILTQFKIALVTATKYLQSRGPKFQLEYRALWLAGLGQQPHTQLSELLSNPVLAYLQQWLVENDHAWYASHQPQAQLEPDPPKPKPFNRPSSVTQPAAYWANRDGQLAEEIRLAARYLRRQPGQPIKVTQAAIWRQLGRHYGRCQSDKFPLTWQTLKGVVDSQATFIVRRLEWVAQSYQAEGVHPTPEALLERAEDYFSPQPQDRDFGWHFLAHLEVQTDEPLPALYNLLPSAPSDCPTFDADLAARVKVVARKLKTQPGYPSRVTAVTIGAKLGQLEVILHHLDMLPQTEASLAEVSETPEAFVLRVLTWAMTHDLELQRCRHRAQLVRRTGLQAYAEIPAVSHLVDEALARLKAQHQPEGRKVIDWAARDEKMARGIIQAAAQLKGQTDPFVRIAPLAICKMIDQNSPLAVKAKSLLPFCRTKLPQTDQAFRAVQESWEQFQLRRLAYLAHQFHQQGWRPTQNQLLKAAKLNLDLGKAPLLVQQAVQEILASLASFPSDHQLALKAQWEALDAKLCPLIEPAAQSLRACTDPLVRISRAALGRHLDHYQTFRENLDKLPHTAKMVARVVETPEEFSIRRIRWFGADYLQRQLRPPSRTRFITQVGVAYVASRPHIRAVISEVLAPLSSFPVDPELV